VYTVIRWKSGTKTRWQLITLIGGAVWVTASILVSEDIFGFVAFAFPGVAAAGLIYTVLSGPFQKSRLILLSVVAAWVSVALFVGFHDCCISPAEALHHYNPLDPEHYHALKTAAAVKFEIFQIAAPGMLLGLIGLWWFKRSEAERFRRIEWEVDHSAASQPFPAVSLEMRGSLANPVWNFCFTCHCGAEVMDELPEASETFTVSCPLGCYEYYLVRKGKKLQIVACRI
jgi:hypothetical protein